jgi:tRNA modification GTPase
MRSALDDLGSLAGDITPDDVLGRIFASFCVGK